MNAKLPEQACLMALLTPDEHIEAGNQCTNWKCWSCREAPEASQQGSYQKPLFPTDQIIVICCFASFKNCHRKTAATCSPKSCSKFCIRLSWIEYRTCTWCKSPKTQHVYMYSSNVNVALVCKFACE